MSIEFTKIEPNVWKPENEGDEITGVLVKVDDSKKFDVGNKIYHLDTTMNQDNPQQEIIFGTTVLNDRMAHIVIGDIVRITFKGTTPSEKGNPTKLFDVEKGKKTEDVADEPRKPFSPSSTKVDLSRKSPFY